MKKEHFIDLNKKAEVILKPQSKKLLHFYPEHIPEFKVDCLHQNEIIAEKVQATCNRYKPRDYLDLYYIIKRKLPISRSLVQKKFALIDKEFSVELLFKKTNRIYNEWNSDTAFLVRTKVPFAEVMQTLKKHFKYK
ncbi:MAG: nucleotidyl transferase AbiEii/AbiGii toxin family protein [Candidatus Nanoarchaeia archaeon]